MWFLSVLFTLCHMDGLNSVTCMNIASLCVACFIRIFFFVLLHLFLFSCGFLLLNGVKSDSSHFYLNAFIMKWNKDSISQKAAD